MILVTALIRGWFRKRCTDLYLLWKLCQHFLSQHALPCIADRSKRQTHLSFSLDQLHYMHRRRCLLTGLSVFVSCRLFIQSKWSFICNSHTVCSAEMWPRLPRRGQRVLLGCWRRNKSLRSQWFLLFDQLEEAPPLHRKKEALLTNMVQVEWMILFLWSSVEARTTASWWAGPRQLFGKHVWELCKSAPIKRCCFFLSCLVVAG